MKILVLLFSFLFSIQALGADAASRAVLKALDEGARILDMRSDSSKRRSMCSWVKRHVNTASIANRWMGNYKDLARDSAGARSFTKVIPSYMVTKIFPEMKDMDGESGTYSVSETSTRRSDGNYSVAVRIATSSRTYNGRAIVSSRYKFVDVEYLGFSGVNYVGKDIKKELDGYYRQDPSRSLPMTEFVRKNSSQPGFINCN